MAGHNKWSKIKHKKASADSAKSRVFSKMTRLIAVESAAAKGDRSAPGLRASIDKARSYNIPIDTIERAIERGLQKDASMLERVIYEAYGPAGCAFLVVSLTDNKNRSAAEVRHTLSSFNLSIAQPGSALWMFEQKAGEYIAKNTIPLSDEERGVLKKIEKMLLNLDDVDHVVSNAAI